MSDENPFGDLRNIDEERKSTLRKPSVLEQVMAQEERIVEYAAEHISPGEDFYGGVGDGYEDKIGKAWRKTLAYMAGELRALDVSMDVVQDYVLANRDREKEDNFDAERGLYTSAMLAVATENAHQRGERAVLHIDGRGRVFDYLFYYAQDVDALHVENVVGYKILLGAGSYGKIGTLIARNLKGDAIVYGAAYKGEADGIVLKGIQGVQTAVEAGCYGRIKVFAARELHDPDNDDDIGPCASLLYRGTGEVAVFENITGGEGACIDIGGYGSIGEVVMKGVNNRKAYHQLEAEGSIGQASLITRFKLPKQKPERIGTLLTGDAAQRRYEEVKQQYRIDELFEGGGI